jgi:hypothetical protein
MAGMVLLGVPILGGLVGGTVLQVAMHSAAMSLYERIAVELALISFGAIVIYIFPPGSAREGENWCKFMLFGTMVTTGGFAMAEGLIVNIVPGGAATVLKVLGVLGVALCAKCWLVRREAGPGPVSWQGSGLVNRGWQEAEDKAEERRRLGDSPPKGEECV